MSRKQNWADGIVAALVITFIVGVLAAIVFSGGCAVGFRGDGTAVVGIAMSGDLDAAEAVGRKAGGLIGSFIPGGAGLGEDIGGLIASVGFGLLGWKSAKASAAKHTKTETEAAYDEGFAKAQALYTAPPQTQVSRTAATSVKRMRW